MIFFLLDKYYKIANIRCFCQLRAGTELDSKKLWANVVFALKIGFNPMEGERQITNKLFKVYFAYPLIYTRLSFIPNKKVKLWALRLWNIERSINLN